MAKVKGMMGTKLIGKLGPAVYYMRGGQNINRELAASVSNPKTEAQMNQRTKLANLVHLYQANKAWMERFAFENKPETQTVYNAFMAVNLGISQVYLTKAQAERNMTVLAPEQFTKGSLPIVPVQPFNTEDLGWVTGIKVSDDPNATFDRVSDLSSAILQYNRDWEDGDQLSIVVNVSLPNRVPVVYSYELTIDTTDNRFLADLSINEVIVFSEFDENGYLKITSENPVVYDNTGRGIIVIHSRKTSSGILVSDATMSLNPDAQELYDASSTDAARSAARRSYGGVREPFLVPGGESEGGVVGPTAHFHVSIDGCTLSVGSYNFSQSGDYIIETGDNLECEITPMTGYDFDKAVWLTDSQQEAVNTRQFTRNIEEGKTYGIICVCPQSE